MVINLALCISFSYMPTNFKQQVAEDGRTSNFKQISETKLKILNIINPITASGNQVTQKNLNGPRQRVTRAKTQ